MSLSAFFFIRFASDGDKLGRPSFEFCLKRFETQYKYGVEARSSGLVGSRQEEWQRVIAEGPFGSFLRIDELFDVMNLDRVALYLPPGPVVAD